MDITTKEQRRALKRVFDRVPLYYNTDAFGVAGKLDGFRPYNESDKAMGFEPVTYREFRQEAGFGYDGVMIIHWVGMWLGIERDGYTHS